MKKYELIVATVGRVLELAEEQIAEFGAICEIRQYRKGQAFVRAGELNDRLAIVASGLFRAYYLTAEGKRLIRRFYRTSDVVGSFATAISNAPAHVTIDAIEDSSVVQFAFSDFAQLRSRHLCWERINRILLERHYVQRENRAYELLAFDATERYRLFREEYTDVLERIPKADIASYLGISPESLSRIIHKK